MSFLKFKALVENQSSQNIKMLKTDNGIKYTVAEFEKFIMNFGIIHQVTVTYNT